MTRTKLILLAGLLASAGAAGAQTAQAPANVVTPAPAPREGTVGPEQLRDFALPGTRQPAEQPAAETPRTAPPPVVRTVPAPGAAAPSTTATPPRAAPPAQERARAQAQVPADEAPAATSTAATSALPSTTLSPAPEGLPLPQDAAPLPPISVSQGSGEATAAPFGWWPWALAAVLAGIGLALVLRQRRRPAAAGHAEDPEPPLAFEAPIPPPPVAPPAPPPAAAPRPAGLVTTRLRSPVADASPPPPPVAAPPSGGVVSRRLRGWIEIDLAVREILFDEAGALFRVDLTIGNGGTAAARDIALEAVTTNAGDDQATELAAFFERPGGASVAIPELGPLSNTVLSHELRMPRSAVQAYEAQGKALFVPVVALNAVYRTGTGEGRTGNAFLVGRHVAGSEKLAPLLLPAGAGRLLGLGVRRLDEAVRR